MYAYSVTGRPLPVGHEVTVFSNNPPAVGTELEIVDTRRQVLNVAVVTSVESANQATRMSNAQQRYAIRAQVQA